MSLALALAGVGSALLCYLTGKTRSDLFTFVHAPSRGVQIPEIGGQTIVVSVVLLFLLPTNLFRPAVHA